MPDPLQKLLLTDQDFARLSTEAKLAYIHRVLRALAADLESDPGPDTEAPDTASDA